MSSDDPLEDWIAARRSAFPPPPSDLADRVMKALPPLPAPRAAPPPGWGSRLETAATLLLFACSLAVAVIRLSSFVGIVLPPPGAEPEIAREFFEEQPHVPVDVT